MTTTNDSWAFFRAGGVDQVALSSGDDVARLRHLDQKLWIALACPVKGTELDERTLALLDADGDGRVRAPEVLSAIDWCLKVFRSCDPLMAGADAVALSSFNEATAEGAAALACARDILRNGGRAEAREITLADVEAAAETFAKTRFNGDGVVPPESAGGEVASAALTEVMVALGSTPDRSGLPGADSSRVEAFFEQASALLAWDAEGPGLAACAFGDATAAAADALAAVEDKIVDYFARCRLVAFDARGAAALNASEAEFGALGARTLRPTDDEVAKLPLARVEADRALPLGETEVNPAWAERVAAFNERAVARALGARARLTEPEFRAVAAKLAAYRAWLGRKPAGPVAALDVARLRALVGSGVKEELLALVGQDAARADEYARIASVERAVRYHRDLVRFLRNFVNFSDFYEKKAASFQAGTLYLDARACSLTVFVADAAKHAALAALSRAYLVYCDCTRAGYPGASIVAVVSDGDVDNLMVGRNGVFYDRQGRDWDATVTSIVANPIGVRQAFWAPYKRLVRALEEFVAKRAADRDKEATARTDELVTAATSANPAAAAAPGGPKALDVGTVAAIGVAVGGIGAFLATAFGTFFGLGAWMPLGILGVLLAISGPSMLIAWLKLRQRNMGPILDANGWAINGRVKLNVPFGRSLTDVAALPAGSARVRIDPYAERPTPWRSYVLLLIVLATLAAWVSGKADPLLPGRARFGTYVHAGPLFDEASCRAARRPTRPGTPGRRLPGTVGARGPRRRLLSSSAGGLAESGGVQIRAPSIGALYGRRRGLVAAAPGAPRPARARGARVARLATRSRRAGRIGGDAGPSNGGNSVCFRLPPPGPHGAGRAAGWGGATATGRPRRASTGRVRRAAVRGARRARAPAPGWRS
jgi:hypothetical protein